MSRLHYCYCICNTTNVTAAGADDREFVYIVVCSRKGALFFFSSSSFSLPLFFFCSFLLLFFSFAPLHFFFFFSFLLLFSTSSLFSSLLFFFTSSLFLFSDHSVSSPRGPPEVPQETIKLHAKMSPHNLMVGVVDSDCVSSKKRVPFDGCRLGFLKMICPELQVHFETLL